MSEETFGFNSYSLTDLSRIISAKIGLPARHRENSYWGNYYRFAIDDDHDHFLIWNEIPIGYTDPDEAAEPDFLEWKCIFWTAEGYESNELAAALLSIDGAKLLRPREGAAS